MMKKMSRKKLNLQKLPKQRSEQLRTGNAKEMKMRNTLFYMTLFLMTLPLAAQEVSVEVEYPAVVTAGQQFSVAWTVNSGGGEFSTPPFNGFTKLLGPQTSTSSMTQIINGKMSQQVSYTYVYYLQAGKSGNFVIPPAIFTLKGKTFLSDSMRIEVIGNGSQPQSAASSGSPAQASEEVESAGNDIFVNIALSRKDVYIGEYITATVKIYTRVNLGGINDIKYPTFNGFLKGDIETPQLSSLRQENVNGTIYGSGVIQQFILYPQVTGELTIDPVQISVLMQQKSGKSDPFFGDFFQTVQTVPRTVSSKSMKIRVRPLPGVQPAGYSGIVGRLEIKTTLDKANVKVNDAVNLKYVISGAGNLKVAANPGLKLSPDIEVYDPEITDDLKNTLNGTTGQKTFNYLLIPRHYGDYKIPSIEYSYFNTASGRYETLKTDEFTLHVGKSDDQNTGITVYGGISKEDVKYLGKDIRFIRTDKGDLKKTGNIIVNNQSYYTLFALALIIFLAVLFVRREHIRRNADVSLVKNRKAGKVAIKRLQTAAVCLKNEELDKFYEEMLKAMWGYLSDKLSIPVSELTRSNAITALTESGIDEERIKSLNHILDACEYARFAPSASGAEAETIYEDASQFINSVENSKG
jgi:hypothetical protein